MGDTAGGSGVSDRPDQRAHVTANAPTIVFVHVQLRPIPAIDYLSRGIEVLTGHDRTTLAHDPRLLLRLVQPADRRRLIAYLRNRSRWRERIELEITNADGSTRVIEAWLALELDAESMPVAIDIAARPLDDPGE
jgi:hypothetical protein